MIMQPTTSFSEKIATTLSFLNMSAWIYISCILTVLSLIVFILIERKRTPLAVYKQKLKALNNSETTKIVSENYDIKSSKNIAHTEHEEYKQKAKTYNVCTIISIIAATIFMLSILICTSMLQTYNTAKRHGYYENTFNITASSLWRGINNSPIEDICPEDLSQKLIIYYKFGCKDCEAVYHQVQEALNDQPDVYWISTRSTQGKALLEKCPVEEVPTAIYITADGTQLNFKLYYHIGSDPALDDAQLAYLITAINYDRNNN